MERKKDNMDIEVATGTPEGDVLLHIFLYVKRLFVKFSQMISNSAGN